MFQKANEKEYVFLNSVQKGTNKTQQASTKTFCKPNVKVKTDKKRCAFSTLASSWKFQSFQRCI